MAESEGFEPSIGVSLYALSRGAPSATRPALRFKPTIISAEYYYASKIITFLTNV